jgi:hypothetical protein
MFTRQQHRDRSRYVVERSDASRLKLILIELI